MAVRIKVTVDIDILLAIEDAASKSPVLMKTAYKRAIDRRMRSRILAALKEKSGSTVYPIRWSRSKNPQDSGKRANTAYGYYSRQKAAYYATNGFGRGIPSASSGNMRDQWRVDISPDTSGGEILEIVNDVSYSVYVSGVWMQPFHIDAGYADAQKVASDFREEAEEVLIQTYFAIADPTAGVKVKDE